MMRLFFVFLVLTFAPACHATDYQPASGDIVFHTSRSAQSELIQRITNSRYSHMGIVHFVDGIPQVFEAVEPVRSTPLGEWIRRGEDARFVVKRLKGADSILSPVALHRMAEVGQGFVGKHYDLVFGWSDQRIYCSELVWKIYQRALGIELCDLEKFGDFDLSDERVREEVERRFSGAIPADDPAVSPAAIYRSGLLVTVYRQ